MEPLEQPPAPAVEENYEDVFEFVYDGPDVANGTMSARELVEVITGLTRAFSTVSHELDYGDSFEVRVKDIDHASFHLIFEAIAYAKANPIAATAVVGGALGGWKVVTDTASGAYKVITDLAKIIDAKIKTKGARIATLPATFIDGAVQVQGPDGLLQLTKSQYELLLSQRVDRSLSQVVSPLSIRRIDRFEFRRSSKELVSVKLDQRDYFDYQEVTEERVREGNEIIGILNSLTKSSLRGTFYTADGIHVPYKYVGGDVQQLLKGFSSQEPVLVRGRVKFGPDGIPTQLEIEDVIFRQESFSFEAPTLSAPAVGRKFRLE